MLEFYCNKNGEYVQKLNEIEDYYSYPTMELKTLYDNKTTYWCEINEDGTGSITQGNFGTDDLEFDTEKNQWIIMQSAIMNTIPDMVHG